MLRSGRRPDWRAIRDVSALATSSRAPSISSSDHRSQCRWNDSGSGSYFFTGRNVRITSSMTPTTGKPMSRNAATYSFVCND